jgi:hypothetical protein
MAMIDLILETAQRLRLDHAPRSLAELHRVYLRDHPDITAGRSEGSFSASLNFHTINMQSRFPKSRDPRMPAPWLRRRGKASAGSLAMLELCATACGGADVVTVA